MGFYEVIELIYVARVRNGFTPWLREALPSRAANCHFINLPQRDKSRWGQGLTSGKMAECRWLEPRLIAQIELAEWTGTGLSWSVRVTDGIHRGESD